MLLPMVLYYCARSQTLAHKSRRREMDFVSAFVFHRFAAWRKKCETEQKRKITRHKFQKLSKIMQKSLCQQPHARAHKYKCTQNEI